METTMNAKRQEIDRQFKLRCGLRTFAPNIEDVDVRTLCKAAGTLHRWFERERNGEIQRDEDTGIAYWYNTHTGKRLSRARDMERAAMRAIEETCEYLGLHFFIQTDPRGGTLYVSGSPIEENRYSSTAMYVK